MEFATDAQKWSRQIFGGCKLGDRRRTNRVVSYVSLHATQPDASIPTVCRGKSAVQEGIYRLIENERVDALAIEEGTCKRFLKNAEKHSRVLVIQDTTTLSFNHSLREELSDVGAPRTKGLLVHSALLVEPEKGDVLGLGAQKWWVRPKDRPGTGKRNTIPYEEKESYKWEETLRQVLARTKRKERLITVCDREADIHELLQFHSEQGVDYVIRARHSRALEAPLGDLRGVLQQQAAIGAREVVVEQRGPVTRTSSGQPRAARSRRKVQTEIRTATVTTMPGRRGGRKSLTLNAVLVSEVGTPPPGTEPLDWLLITSLPVESKEAATQVIEYYELRWLIEEFHKCWKTGCALEQKRFQSVGNLERAMVILAPIAARLLQLRTAYENDSDKSCERLLKKPEWQPLALREPP